VSVILMHIADTTMSSTLCLRTINAKRNNNLVVCTPIFASGGSIGTSNHTFPFPHVTTRPSTHPKHTAFKFTINYTRTRTPS
jgi:hypothetical protein